MKKGIKVLTAIIVLTMMNSCHEQSKSKRKTDFVISVGGNAIEVIEVDGCEYLYYSGSSRTALAHKGNCKNH